MHLSDLDTPSVLIDIDRMERNIQRMQAHCDALGLRFRPHISTHKIPDIARLQIEAGAQGLACLTVSEAEVLVAEGYNNIQLPYNVVGAQKTARLSDLALYNTITAAADHVNVLAGLADAAKVNEISIRVLIELATDLHRSGVPFDEVVPLAKRIEQDENLHFAGLLVYPSYPRIRPVIQAAIEALNAIGIGVDVVSGGGTGASFYADQIPELTELCAGTYVFNDLRMVVNQYATLEDCAMTVLARVVSRPTSDRVILDCGSKTLSADLLASGYGLIMEYPEAKVYSLNAEHAHADMSACAERPVIGETVRVIPVNAGMVTNLHDEVFGARGDQVEVAWQVTARGRY